MWNWDMYKYTRRTVDLADTATSYGFSAAKSSTRFTFSLTRGIIASAIGATCATVDNAFFGGAPVARPVIEDTTTRVIAFCEQAILAPIFFTEYITTTSLIAAHSSINVLSVLFPDSSESSFSLTAVITVLRRDVFGYDGIHAPSKQYSFTKVARGLIAWIALQGATQEWQEKQWFKFLREIPVNEPNATPHPQRSRRSSRVRVTSDIIFPGNRAQIVAADIGEAPPGRTVSFSSPQAPHSPPLPTQRFFLGSFTPHYSPSSPVLAPQPLPSSTPAHAHHYSHSQHLHHYHHHQPQPHYHHLQQHGSNYLRPPLSAMAASDLKSEMRRLSKMVMAGYGGATLFLVGVAPHTVSPPSSRPMSMVEEEARVAHAVSASEAEAAGEGEEGEGGEKKKGEEEKKEYSWWDVLLGKHDQEIFERAAGLGRVGRMGKRSEKAKKELKKRLKSTAVIGSEHAMPRFWILTDHGRAQVVLVIRGTVSLNEIAADLTCLPEEFEPAMTPDPAEYDYPTYPTTPAEQIEDGDRVSAHFPFPSTGTGSARSSFYGGQKSCGSSTTAPRYHVHSGMLKLAKAMGDIGKPVHLAVREALSHNPDYDLVLCGHSLGAGVAGILGMMWADPRTCLTVPQSELPPGRRVSVYCFAPPAMTDVALGRLTSNLITSFVYSYDAVSRLSVGSISDLRNAATWLCEAEQEGTGEAGSGAVTTRVRKWTALGEAEAGEELSWFIAVRKTLEANMQISNMFPPGRVLWALWDKDLHPIHRATVDKRNQYARAEQQHDKMRLFEVLDVEKVFGQMVFAKDMVTSHLVHEYDRALHHML